MSHRKMTDKEIDRFCDAIRGDDDLRRRMHEANNADETKEKRGHGAAQPPSIPHREF